MEDAYRELIYIATKEKWQHYDSALEANAYTLYKNNNRINQVQDTLDLLTFLKPGINPDSTEKEFQNLKNGLNVERIDSARGVLQMNSEMLPPEVRNRLWDCFEKLKNKSSIIGPISTSYGTWLFKVKKVRPGHGKIPFSHVRRQLMDSMVISCMDSGLWVVDTSIKMDSVSKNIALANVYKPRFYGINADNKNRKKKPEEQEMIVNRHKEVEKWCSQLVINSALFEVKDE
jgi:hypothetical protein